jgi:hypothetical protein
MASNVQSRRPCQFGNPAGGLTLTPAPTNKTGILSRRTSARILVSADIVFLQEVAILVYGGEVIKAKIRQFKLMSFDEGNERSICKLNRI